MEEKAWQGYNLILDHWLPMATKPTEWCIYWIAGSKSKNLRVVSMVTGSLTPSQHAFCSTPATPRAP